MTVLDEARQVGIVKSPFRRKETATKQAVKSSAIADFDMFDSQSKTLLLSFALAVLFTPGSVRGGLVSRDLVTGTGGGGTISVQLTRRPQRQ